MQKKPTIRRATIRLNKDDSDFLDTLQTNSTMNESESIRFCMYVTRELLQAQSINIHVKNTFLQAALSMLSVKLHRLVTKSINEGEKFDKPNDEKMGWHKCINIFQGITNIREKIKRKKINRLG